MDSNYKQLTKEDFMISHKSQPGISQMDGMENEEDGGYYEGAGDGEDYEDEEEAEKNIKAPEMPNEFYQEIDMFLKKPPPKFKMDDPNANSAKKKKKKKDSPPDYNPPTSNYLPPIHQTSYDLYQNEYNVDQLPPPAAMDYEDYPQDLGKPPRKGKKKANNPDQVYQNPVNPHKGAKPKMIDSQLLREAFAYTDQLLREAVVEEANSMAHDQEAQQQQQQERGKRQAKSAPAEMMSHKVKNLEDAYQHGTTGGGGGGKKKGTNHRVGMIRNLKQQQQAEGAAKNIHSSAFSVVTNVQENESAHDSRRNPLNYEDLVYNFQHGVNLEKLRKELADSRQSLAQSEHVIRELSSQYLRK
jgi:hypothetical protein